MGGGAVGGGHLVGLGLKVAGFGEAYAGELHEAILIVGGSEVGGVNLQRGYFHARSNLGEDGSGLGGLHQHTHHTY